MTGRRWDALTTPREWLAPAPAERLAALRIVVVGFALVYLVVRTPHLFEVFDLADDAPQRFRPVGPLVPLDEPVPVPVMVAFLVATMTVGCLALVGWRWRAVGPAFAVGVLVVSSYRNSWGQIFHTENLVVLHLGILACAPAAAAWSLDRRRGDRVGSPTPEPTSRFGYPAQLMVLVVVVAYVLAGWAKIRASGIGWIDGDALRNLVAHDALRKELVGDSGSPFATLALRNDWVFAPMATFSLAVELAAPVALLGGRWRLGWAAAAWVFHLGVLVVMGIMFPYQFFGPAFAAFIALEVVGRRLIDSRRHRAPRRAILAS